VHSGVKKTRAVTQSIIRSGGIEQNARATIARRGVVAGECDDDGHGARW